MTFLRFAKIASTIFLIFGTVYLIATGIVCLAILTGCSPQIPVAETDAGVDGGQDVGEGEGETYTEQAPVTDGTIVALSYLQTDEQAHLARVTLQRIVPVACTYRLVSCENVGPDTVRCYFQIQCPH